jgi:MFS family permease
MSVATPNRALSHGAEERRVLSVACGAHALHDGFTDLLYVLLPLWRAEFALGYAEIGLLLYAGAMAGFQIPAGMLAARFGGPLLLALGTALAGIGYLIAGASGGFVLLALGLLVGGLGSSTQHPIASDLVAHGFAGARSRPALGTYNFAGDLGKMALPAATALLLAWMPWRSTALTLGLVGLAGAVLIVASLPRTAAAPGPQPASEPGRSAEPAQPARPAAGNSGFPILLAIGVIDSATRMAFLTFLPFLLTAKGAQLPTIGAALTLVFAGGAAGKLVCGFLGARFGMFRTVLLTEAATAVGIAALVPLGLEPAMILLAPVGVALNGTSSVLYGTVPELVAPERRARAFGVFYTGTIGSGAVSPAIYGLFGDALSLATTVLLIAGVVLLTLPLAWRLNSRLPASAPVTR